MGGTDEAREALRQGLSLARTAFRQAWAPPAVCTAGWTALFVAGRGGLPPEAAAALAWTGLALVLLMTPSKLGALHRLAARGEAPAPPGPAGLQATAVEARLTATAVALCALAVLMSAAFGTLAAAGLSALRPLGRVGAGPLAPLSLGFVLSLPALLLGVAAGLQGLGRLAVTLAADACEPGPRFARGWILTRGAGAAPALVLVASLVAPLAGLLALGGAIDALGSAGGPPAGRWSLPEALAAGALLAGLTQFVLAPMNAGALAHLRRTGLARAAAAQRTVDTPGPLGDKAPPAGSAAAPASPEILPA